MSIRLDTPSESKTVKWMGDLVRLPIRSTDTSGQFSAQLANLSPGAGNPPHVHTKEAECFYVLEGQVEVSCGTTRHELSDHDLIYLPPGLPHQLKTTSDCSARLLVLLTGGAIENAFIEASGTDASQIGKIFAEYGVEIMDEYDGTYRPAGFESVSESDVIVSRAGEGDAYWLAGDTYTVRFAGEHADDKLAVVHFDIPPGGGPIPHVHGRDFESFFIIDGEVELYADGAIVTGHVNDVAVLPINIPHCFKNRTDTRAQMIAVVAPAGFDRFIAEAGVPARPGESAPPVNDDEKKRLIATAPKYGITLRPDIEF